MNKNLNEFLKKQRTKQSQANTALKRIRVIDMATLIAAPFAATLLGDYGAEIIKIENPNSPDAIRNWGGFEENSIQPFWSVFSRNKYTMTLNLKTLEGKQILLDLVKKSDVLIQNMRPGALERLGLAPSTLLEVNPGLVIGSISGYGKTGPYAEKPGFGTLAEAFSGFTYLNAHPDAPPTNPPLALADLVAGTHLAFGIMVALFGQKRNEKGGQEIDCSLYEPLFGMLGPDFLQYSLTNEVPKPKGNELSYMVPRNNYCTKDNNWVTLSGAAQSTFARIMEAVGHPEMISDPRYKKNEARVKSENRDVINKVISAWIKNQTSEEIIQNCNELGLTVGPIMSMADIYANEQYQKRKSVVELEDPTTLKKIKVPNVPFRMLETPGNIRFPGLPVGAANSIICKDILKYSNKKYSELVESGAM
jgi:formyl-CoA transferase